EAVLWGAASVFSPNRRRCPHPRADACMAGPNAGASEGGYTSSVPLPGRVSDRTGPRVAAARLRVTKAAAPAHRAGLAHQAHEDFRDGRIERLALRSAERGQSLLEKLSPRPRHPARPAGWQSDRRPRLESAELVVERECPVGSVRRHRDPFAAKAVQAAGAGARYHRPGAVGFLAVVGAVGAKHEAAFTISEAALHKGEAGVDGSAVAAVAHDSVPACLRVQVAAVVLLDAGACQLGAVAELLVGVLVPGRDLEGTFGVGHERSSCPQYVYESHITSTDRADAADEDRAQNQEHDRCREN